MTAYGPTWEAKCQTPGFLLVGVEDRVPVGHGALLVGSSPATAT